MAANSCFKAYDIRGVVPSEIDGEFAFGLGNACGKAFGAKRAVIGQDARLSSPLLADELAAGLNSAGIEVFSLGLCGTEEIYHAAANGDFDIGIMITGSHNPADQNGFKFVLRGALPVSGQKGLDRLQALMQQPCRETRKSSGSEVCEINLRRDYLGWLLDYCGVGREGKPLKVVVNAGNGCAGPVVAELSRQLPFEFVPLHYEPDGHFPNGVPNPLLPERREDTSRAVIASKADLGIAFDGDFDRCFFFDEEGNFIEGYYLVGILATAMLSKNPGAKIVHDPRLYWNTRDMTIKAGGIPIMGKTGHAFMKERMRSENALYGGEMSSHHYYRDFAFCDSGMLTMLLMLKFLQGDPRTLGEVVKTAIAAYPCSGEINFRIGNMSRAMDRVNEKFGDHSLKQDRLDGINMEFRDWRFSLRPSNTESLLRLNVESRGDVELMREKTEEISNIIRQY